MTKTLKKKEHKKSLILPLLLQAFLISYIKYDKLSDNLTICKVKSVQL